jgi:D-glycero-D-manno-heptose 1,7-bisphosphate phosphatase
LGNDNKFANIDCVFLDRDGVINRPPPAGQFVTRWQDLDLLPGAAEAIAALNRAGCKVIVVTNQRGVALGLYSLDELNRIHEHMRQLLTSRGANLDGVYSCPHDEGECGCRKPRTGLFEQAFGDFSTLAPATSVMIGDSLRDIEAGRKLGMRTVLVGDTVDRCDSEFQRAKGLADLTLPSLAEFVRRHVTP